jgi:methionyl-tRNA formyltransferase
LKIVFLGTGDIGLPALEALADSDEHELAAVFTQPDRPFGRKGELKPPAVKVFSEERGVPVHQPEKIRKGDALETLRGYAPEVIVVVAYGQILPKSVLELPSIACINLHASILPKHRGAAPIQAAILAGDEESGMTVMHIDIGLDSGDIILIEKFPLAPDETGGSLHERLAEAGPAALMKALQLLGAGDAPRTRQDHDAATHIGKLDRKDGEIDWSQSAVDIERRVRAFDPWPGTSAVFPDGVVKVFPPAEVLPEGKGQPGEVLEAGKAGVVVACGEGALRIIELQPAGKKRMAAGAYLAGRPLQVGSVLGNQ